MTRYSLPIFKKRNKSINQYGGIEEICIGYISGWIFNKKNRLNEIRLLYGEKVLASTKINIFRSDIKEKYKVDYKTGFLLRLKINTQFLEKNENISLIAMNSAGNFNQELFLLKDPNSTSTLIKDIISSPYVGMDGHIDDLTESGELIGWATSYNRKDSSIIWLQNHKNESKPKKIICNLHRDDLYKKGINNGCGFKIYTENIYEKHKNIFFSFDYEGKYKIKFSDTVLKKIQDLRENKVSSGFVNLSKIEESKVLEGIDLTLSKLETFIENLENDIAESKKKNYFFIRLWMYLKKIKKNLIN